MEDKVVEMMEVAAEGRQRYGQRGSAEGQLARSCASSHLSLVKEGKTVTDPLAGSPNK